MNAATITPQRNSRRLADRLGAAGLRAAANDDAPRARFSARLLRTAANALGGRTSRRHVAATVMLDGAARDIEEALDLGAEARRLIAETIPEAVLARTIEAVEAAHHGETLHAALEGCPASAGQMSRALLHRAKGVIGRTAEGRLRVRTEEFTRALVFQLALDGLERWKPLKVGEVVTLMRAIPILRSLDASTILDEILDAGEVYAERVHAGIGGAA